MPSITYVEFNGNEHTVDVEENMSLMEGSTINLLPGIEGMCGGICSCCTCHVYIEPEWEAKVNPISEGEKKLVEASQHYKDNSRLGCQVIVTYEMEGMRVHLPPDQN
ncbi:MAG TPA: 2Fe-2S iron-sulfur cluster-binding protein [Pseudomonadales bacterium]|jgi:2Fe-2S ferredoxin|nr:2Fe-2S iron-sulfur cluster-binding protein [Pseudomonadales bacterium]